MVLLGHNELTQWAHDAITTSLLCQLKTTLQHLGNALVLSSKKPLPEPMLTQIYITIFTTSRPQWVNSVGTCPKTVDSPNTILQKITRGIFCTQFVQCNDGAAGDKCMFLPVFIYSSNPLTQICEIVQLTRWAHRKFPRHFLYFFLLPVNSAAHNTLTPSCDCLMWLVSNGEEKQNVCIGVLKQSMFLLQQNCTTFLRSTLGLVSTSCGQTAALTPESGDVW